MIPGIDVSHYQGEIDWAKVKASGVEFAFIKASDGADYWDPLYTANLRMAQFAGVLAAPYHFMRPGNVEGQITRFSPCVHGPLLKTCALDVEVDAITLAEVEQFMAAFPNSVLYSDPAQLDRLFEVTRAPSGAAAAKVTASPVYEHALWVAEYGKKQPFPFPFGTWTFWQYGQGRVPGISVPVDLDSFNGSLEDLQAFWKA